MSTKGVSIIYEHFPDLSETQKEQFAKLEALYIDWNSKINVISRKDIDELYTRHVLHSLAIAKFISFNDGTRILDVGTGGGFPGIPLAIMFPQCSFVLVDAILKKINVVNEIIAALGLTNVVAMQKRAEGVKEKFHFVVSRAVTRMQPFIGWVHQTIENKSTHMLSNGIIALKGGNLTEELRETRRPYQEVNISEYFDDEFFETKKVIYVPVATR